MHCMECIIIEMGNVVIWENHPWNTYKGLWDLILHEHALIFLAFIGLDQMTNSLNLLENSSWRSSSRLDHVHTRTILHQFLQDRSNDNFSKNCLISSKVLIASRLKLKAWTLGLLHSFWASSFSSTFNVSNDLVELPYL